jgi:formate--tetrahydrofolate ligase
MNVSVAVSEVYSKGSEGGMALAENVLNIIREGQNNFNYVYPLEMSIREKIETIAKKIYGADGVDFTGDARKELATLESLGFGDLPVCMAKTQYSLSDDPRLLGRPEGFRITVRQVKVSAGAGFVVAMTGSIMTMPGLPKEPAAEKIDVDENGRITGLF